MMIALDRLLLFANLCSLALGLILLAQGIWPSLRCDDPVGLIMIAMAMLLGRPLAAGR